MNGTYKTKIGITGATGYVGIEIIRLLLNHPGVEVTAVFGQSYVGKKISDVYPNLRGIFDMELEAVNMETLADKADLFINCLPHGISKDFIPLLLEKGKKIIDHGGDYRYKDVKVYEKWYKTTHELPELLNIAVYGLPELYRDKIRSSSLTSNPGCYPTTAILGLAPMLKGSYVKTENIIVDSASGVTGAGRKTDLPFSFCESTENFKAYNVAVHRHTSEIEQELSILAGKDLLISFTPHLVPMKRGMLSTIYANIDENYKNLTTSDFIDIYRSFYKDERFVRILDEGILPETKNVAGSNFIDIGIVIDKRLNRAVILSAVDNLGKGASSQAVQDMNIMLGFPEDTALVNPGYYL